jgi:kynureninase
MEFTEQFAQQQDSNDQLKGFRNKFIIPKHNGTDAVYFCGNSLGLQPKNLGEYIQAELDVWAELGVEGHFTDRTKTLADGTTIASGNWMPYHERFSNDISKIVGALPSEVVVMNQLTVNLHLLMASFYRPTKERFKIICEKKPFPSDSYAFESQARMHGFDPKEAVIEIDYSDGYYTATQQIIDTINQHGNELAVVIIGGVNYYNGQLYDMKIITEATHKTGAYCGFDLAHAAGNVALELHNWNVDFACWCSYKYLNSGPGSVAGAFVHEKHHKSNLPRMAGWWGHNKENRFKMEPGFNPIESAEGWQLSNAPIFSMAAHRASVAIFAEAGMEALTAKSKQLTNYLEFCLQQVNAANTFEIITPSNPAERGCQLSLLFNNKGREVFDALTANGVIADWRNPNVIRIAPVPLYNSFSDCYRFAKIVGDIIID